MSEKDLMNTTDAVIWAKEFKHLVEDYEEVVDINENWLISWFASAIETGRTAGSKEGYGPSTVDKAYLLGYEAGKLERAVQSPGIIQIDVTTSPTDEVMEVIRTLRYVGSPEWIKKTLERSISGELNCGIGKIYESREELKPWSEDPRKKG
jgi:hypothetical protein